jgi:two-component system, NarL family, response regulator NreC
MIRILLSDDHNVVRQGLKVLLQSEPDFDVVADCSDGIETIEKIKELKPDVVVIDMVMPGMDGIEIIKSIKNEQIECKILVLSMHSDEKYVADAFRYGASGYLLKGSTTNLLISAIRQIVIAGKFLDPILTEKALNILFKKEKEEIFTEPINDLTNRELEVLKLVANGHTNIQIGIILKISSRTVEAHRSNMQKKLGITNQAELIRFAISHDLVN